MKAREEKVDFGDELPRTADPHSLPASTRKTVAVPDCAMRVVTVVEDVIRRREAGERVEDQDVISAHPELLPTLKQRMDAVRKVQQARHDAERGTDLGGSDGDQSARVSVPVEWNIPDYEPIMECGRGSYGTVWAVRDRVGVCRALKIVELDRLPFVAADRERKALESYCNKIGSHPYLINIYHISEIDNTLYYTMELADDQSRRSWAQSTFPADYMPLTLRTIIDRAPMRADTAIEIARRLLRGVTRLHRVGLVHRDIKPSNVIIVRGQPRLADIGLVTFDFGTISSVGTPRYMPPDQAMDKTADTYAFGKMLYEMIVGSFPPEFPEFPSQLDWDSSRWDIFKLNDVILKACAPKSSERYENGSDLLDALESCTPDNSLVSLFEELADQENTKSRSGRGLGWSLAFEVARNVPWILLFVLVLLILRWLAQILQLG